jgi:phosphoenolpyruvate synthase/pyruvate phosphate dikinase
METATFVKSVYKFGNSAAEGDGSMKNLLGGKGANLEEMSLMGIPVPPGFTITTEACTTYQKEGEKVVVKGSRVKDIRVLEEDKWVALDPNKTYSILTNSFIALKGGDGYFWFKKYGSDFKNTYETFYSIMANAVQRRGELTPQERDGRLIVVH